MNLLTVPALFVAFSGNIHTPVQISDSSLPTLAAVHQVVYHPRKDVVDIGDLLYRPNKDRLRIIKPIFQVKRDPLRIQRL